MGVSRAKQGAGLQGLGPGPAIQYYFSAEIDKFIQAGPIRPGEAIRRCPGWRLLQGIQQAVH